MAKSPRLDALAKMEYPGRFIILGTIDKEKSFAIYGITGRSPSSQARKMVEEKNQIYVEPTDKEILKTGNPDLLIYPAAKFGAGIVAVSNGKQTKDIFDYYLAREYSFNTLEESLKKWKYEPDAPNFTPRINGVIFRRYKNCYILESVLGIMKRRKNGATTRKYFKCLSEPGDGKLLSTYSGENKSPLPSFEGAPLDVAIKGTTAKKIAEEIWDTLSSEYRVSVACIAPYRTTNAVQMHIINRHDKK